MSGRPKKEEEDKGFLGSLAGGLLLAGGAAAVGYMAYKMFSDDDQPDHCSSSSSRPPPPNRPFLSSSRNGSNTRTRMENRKQEAHKSNKVETPNGTKCIICFENEREILFEPCNHVCACEDCADKIDTNCPVCRKRIVSKKPVYL